MLEFFKKFFAGSKYLLPSKKFGAKLIYMVAKIGPTYHL